MLPFNFHHMESTRNIDKILFNSRVYNAIDALLPKGIYPLKRHELFIQSLENVYRFRHSENKDILQLNSIDRINTYLPLITKSKHLYFSVGTKVDLSKLEDLNKLKRSWTNFQGKAKRSLIVIFFDTDNYNKVRVLENSVILSVQTIDQFKTALENFLQGSGSIENLTY